MLEAQATSLITSQFLARDIFAQISTSMCFAPSRRASSGIVAPNLLTPLATAVCNAPDVCLASSYGLVEPNLLTPLATAVVNAPSRRASNSSLVAPNLLTPLASAM